LSGGMKVPSDRTRIVASVSSTAAITTGMRCRTTQRTTGEYRWISTRLTGFCISPRIWPRIASAASAGVSVTDSNAAKPIA
jgi:hypothetical protein